MICAAASPNCTMPLARPRCSFGTSNVVAAEYAGHWKALKVELIARAMGMTDRAGASGKIAGAAMLALEARVNRVALRAPFARNRAAQGFKICAREMLDHMRDTARLRVERAVKAKPTMTLDAGRVMARRAR